MNIITVLQKHHQAVTFASAAMVIATFLIKDVVRDDTKERLDELNAASQRIDEISFFHQIMSKISDTQSMIKEINADVYDVPITTIRNDPKLLPSKLAIDAASSLSVIENLITAFWHENMYVAVNVELPDALVTRLNVAQHHTYEVPDDVIRIQRMPTICAATAIAKPRT
jgi:hypothetical protein